MHICFNNDSYERLISLKSPYSQLVLGEIVRECLTENNRTVKIPYKIFQQNLDISRSSVGRSIRKLKELGFIERGKNSEITLTEDVILLDLRKIL